MHRILLREVVVDAPSSTFAATRDFWAAALVTQARQVEEFPEFTALPRAASLSWVGLQDIGTGKARFHVDIETDDVEAEVVRLTGLGAVKVADGRTWGGDARPVRTAVRRGAARVSLVRRTIPAGLVELPEGLAAPTA